MGYSNPLDTYLCFHYRPLILLQPISPEIEVTFGLVCHCVNSYSPPTNYWIYYCGHIRLLTRFKVPWTMKGSVNTNLTRFKVPWTMKGSVNTNLTRFKVPWAMKGSVNTNLTRFKVPWAIKGSVNTNLTRFKVPWTMKGSVNTNLTRFKVPWAMKGSVNTINVFDINVLYQYISISDILIHS